MPNERYTEFSELGRDLFVSGLISSHGGNISVREGERIIITKTGSALGRLKPDDLVEVSLAEPSKARDKQADALASVELVVHRALYQRLSDARAVVHTHSPYTTLLSLRCDVIEPLDSEAQHFLPRVPVVAAEQTIGSREVAAALPEALVATSYCPIAVLRGHGPFAVGASLEDAWRWISVLEMSSRILVQAARLP